MWRVILLITITIAVQLEAAKCRNRSPTTTSGTYRKNKKFCSGELIFKDDFDVFDLSKWQHEITLSGGGNWEFQYYTNNRSNSYVENGTLHIRPTFLTDDYDEKFLSSGTLDLNVGPPADRCTDPTYYGCLRTGTSNNYLNPIKSARIGTSTSFSFKYGRVVLRAKMPAGDWLWPAVWLLPRSSAYGSWPASGEIDILESRGNRELETPEGVNVGTQQVSSTLHWGPNKDSNQWQKTHFEKNNNESYATKFHQYELVWGPDNITFLIDDEIAGMVLPTTPDGFWHMGDFQTTKQDNPWKSGSKMAPFDQEFYLIINLAVGGISFFNDGNINPGGKPWKNKSGVAFKEFWIGKDQWLPTWNMETDDTHLEVDYIKVYAI